MPLAYSKSWSAVAMAVACTLQVAQVLLTLPYSFAQLGFVSGVVFQIFYGVVGCWSCYMITSLYVEYRTRKEREGVIFKNHVIQVHCTFRLLYSNFIAADQTPSYICTNIRILAQFVEKIWTLYIYVVRWLSQKTCFWFSSIKVQIYPCGAYTEDCTRLCCWIC